MSAPRHSIATCLALTKAISRSRTVHEIYAAALDALETGLGVERSAILLFDPDGVMRFKAFRGLSDAYRHAVEGHTPWRPDTPDPQPIWVADVNADRSLVTYRPSFETEGIAALAFVPLVSADRVIGKFMLYYGGPTPANDAALDLAGVVAAQVAFALERTRSEAQARRNEERLRFALDAALMGTWDWDLRTNTVQWSDNLARIHGLPDDAFDGTFESYEREIHPDDRARVHASIQHALTTQSQHDVEYRIVAPDGTARWCEGKGRVEYEEGRPVRMSGVCMLVSRRKEAELARLSAAQEASRLKDEFLATLSHELRTPLNAIIGWVDMLEHGQMTASEITSALGVIGRNARLQAQLIEDILDVSRIITGKLEIDRVPISVWHLLDTALSDIAPMASAKGISLERRIATALPPLEADPKRLHQVLNNVLTNAIKFTPAGGSIVLSCEADHTSLRVDVTDSGAGIAAEFLPFVFERFRQGDSRSTRAHGGLGLGLAIAKHLVEQHDGAISARSDGVGQGTTISMCLPVSHQESPRVSSAGRDDTNVRLDEVTCLVVDDDRDSREMIAALLEQRGARVLQSESAQSALTVLGKQPMHLLIADIALPFVDGYELMRRVRDAGHHTPAIAVTAFARPEDRRRALECGYAEHVSKPIDGVKLAQMVRAIVQSTRSDRPIESRHTVRNIAG